MEGKRRRAMQTPTRDWSELTHLAMELITDRLDVEEIKNFRAVCKTWRAFKKTRAVDHLQLPWLLCWNKLNGAGFRLYRHFSVERKENHTFDLKKYKVSSSKDGWIMLLHRRRRRSPPLAFNPFRNILISLPRPGFEVSVVSFSTTPLDVECVYFALGVGENPDDEAVIGTWRTQDPNWNREIVGAFDDAHTVIFSRRLGGFLCVNGEANSIGTFTMQDCLWTTMQIQDFPEDWNLRSHQVVEHEDEIWLLVLDGFRVAAFGLHTVGEQKLWVHKEALKDVVFFTDQSVAVCVMDSVLKYRNTIHFIASGMEVRHCPQVDRGRTSYACCCFNLPLDEAGSQKVWVQPPTSLVSLKDVNLA